jgi:hypothetical protein
VCWHNGAPARRPRASGRTASITRNQCTVGAAIGSGLHRAGHGSTSQGSVRQRFASPTTPIGSSDLGNPAATPRSILLAGRCTVRCRSALDVDVYQAGFRISS